MNITRWEPFREMEDMFRQYSPFFGRWLRRWDDDTATWRPAADITETEKEYLIKAELPEVRKEDVKIELNEGVLTISGERKKEKEEKEANEIRVESFYGTFSRSFALPEDANPDAITAECKDGVVKIHIPKTAEKKPKARKIEIQ
ncbi:MAG TPA: Hsp20/alpha crystallin family protein [Steroidobacteraceae bacterium]